MATLMYHDVVAGDDWDSSGFPGASAAHYKLTRAQFERHLDALAASGLRFPRYDSPLAGTPGSCLLSFDDGGASAPAVARLLEARDMVGHFFITTAMLGRPGFVGAADVCALAAAGHAVGSHSHSHPANIAALAPERLDAEWRDSVAVLSDLLGAPVTLASVPGGFYAPAVAAAAARAGIATLFTSEPSVRAPSAHGCRLPGRYALVRSHTPEQAVALARGDGAARLGQWLRWNLKKPLKRWFGPGYRALRAWRLGT